MAWLVRSTKPACQCALGMPSYTLLKGHKIVVVGNADLG
jgi:hypothetical protein